MSADGGQHYFTWDTETSAPGGGHAPRGAPSTRAARSLGRTHRPRLSGVRCPRATSCQRPPCVSRAAHHRAKRRAGVAYAGPVRPVAALRNSVLCLPTDIHSLFVNKPSSSSSSSFSSSSPDLCGGADTFRVRVARETGIVTVSLLKPDSTRATYFCRCRSTSNQVPSTVQKVGPLTCAKSCSVSDIVSIQRSERCNPEPEQ